MKSETNKMINDILNFMGSDYEKDFVGFGYNGSGGFEQDYNWLKKLNHPSVPEVMVDYLVDLQDILSGRGLMLDPKGNVHHI